jgi:hypothetical protein
VIALRGSKVFGTGAFPNAVGMVPFDGRACAILLPLWGLAMPKDEATPLAFSQSSLSFGTPRVHNDFKCSIDPTGLQSVS